MSSVVKKFSEFDNTSEAVYKPNENGEMELQDYELYLDEHPNKFIYSLGEKTPLFETSKGVWVLKHEDVIIATFADNIDKEVIDNFVNNLKK